MTELLDSPFSDTPAPAPPVWTVTRLHDLHGAFVWRTLYRMGVRAPHVEDVYQEVFLVVHRRLGAFSGRSAITTWLFEICFRVAAGYRRRAHFRREELVTDEAALPLVDTSTSTTPEREVEKRQAAARVQALLTALTVEHRLVFAMFELEGLSSEQISAQLGVPVGTVHSRLSRARKAFARALVRQRVRDDRRPPPTSTARRGLLL